MDRCRSPQCPSSLQMFGFPEYGAPTVFMWSLSLGHTTGPVVEEDRTFQRPKVCWGLHSYLPELTEASGEPGMKVAKQDAVLDLAVLEERSQLPRLVNRSGVSGAVTAAAAELHHNGCRATQTATADGRPLPLDRAT